MVSYTYQDKIILHLASQKGDREASEVSSRITQQGIAERIGTDIPYTNRILKDLLSEGIVQCETKHVVGLKRRRKVYFLTSKGQREARDIKERLEEESVTVRTDEGEDEIKLCDIDRYFEAREPLLQGLNLLDDGVIDLAQTGESEEDIFADREDEMDRLKGFMEKVKEEGCSAVFVSGEAGIGKTHLVMELKKYAVKQDFEFLAGRAYHESSEPYLLFKEAFQKYTSEELDEETDGEAIGGSMSFAAMPKGPEVTNQQSLDSSRFSAWFKITEDVKDIASNHPLMIFLDDLQWADQATLQLLHYMTGNLDDSPVLFIGTYRPEDIQEGHPLKEVIYTLSREDILNEIELDRLDWRATKQIVSGLVGQQDVPDEFVKLVHRTTDGNPLFIRECIKQMLDDGSIDVRRSEYPTSAEEVKIPKMINDVIKRRVERLDDDTEMIIKKASVIGDSIPYALLRDILDIEEIDMLEHVDILLDSGLWYEDPGEEIFSFSHSLIHKVVYNEISEVMKPGLHRAVAESIGRIYEDVLEERYSDLGYHYRRGDDIGKAVKYYYKAGKEAEKVYAHEDAAKMFTRALGCLDEGDAEEAEVRRLTILEELGDVYSILGKYEKAIEMFQEEEELAEQDEVKARSMRKMAKVFKQKGEAEKSLEISEKGLKLTGESDIERCRLLNYKGWALMRLGAPKKAVELFEEEKDLADRIGEKEEKAQALHDFGSACIRQGEYESAERYIQEAIDTREDIDDKEGLAISYNNIGILYNNKGELDKALEYHQLSLDIRKDIGDKHGIGVSLNNIGIIYEDKGELDKALEYQERSLDIKKKMGDKRGTAASLNNLGIFYTDKGDLDKALDYHQRSLDLKKEIGDKRGTAASLNNIGIIYMDKGDLDKALEYQERSLDINQDMGDEHGLASTFNSMGDVYKEKGELDKALEKHKRALELGRKIGLKQAEVVSLFGLIETRIKKGLVEKAREDAEEAVQIAENLGSKLEEGMSHIVLAMAYREEEEWGDAEDEFKEAIDILKEIENKKKLSKAHYEFGSLWAARGEKDRAVEHLEKSLSMYEEMGMELGVKKTKELLDSISD
ncbi:MAG: tetratricopeptide repeat protein [Candidatus Thermoplasmatota archaeon]